MRNEYLHPVPDGAKPCFVSLKCSFLTVDEVIKLEAAIAWLAQHGYDQAEEVATILGSLTGREMHCDQPYYNSFAWRSA